VAQQVKDPEEEAMGMWQKKNNNSFASGDWPHKSGRKRRGPNGKREHHRVGAGKKASKFTKGR